MTANFIEKFNPATDTFFYKLEIPSDSSLEQTILQSLKAFHSWKKTSIQERSRLFCRLAKLLQVNKEALAILDCEDTGRPITELMTVDVPSAVECLEYFADEGGKQHSLQEELNPRQGYHFSVTKVPYGVTLGLGAFNYPLQIACWKLAPALMAGNSMIFCPSEHTSRSALMLEKLMLEASFPPGLFSVVVGGRSVAEKLVQDSRIPLISLTGSVGAAQMIVKNSAQHLKKVLTELGGKSPLIILPDAPIEEAVKAAIMANFYSQGEVCSNGTRVFVPKNLLKQFTELTYARMEKIVIGDPMNPQTQMGPLISKMYWNKMHSILEQYKSLCVGPSLKKWNLSEKFKNGYYLPPTMVLGAHDDHPLATEELFAPVMTVLNYEKEDEVVARANNTPFGLAAGIISSDVKRAKALSEELVVGVCWINNYNITPVGMPFGGAKMSGSGRENSWHALNDYSWLKSTYCEEAKIICTLGDPEDDPKNS